MRIEQLERFAAESPYDSSLQFQLISALDGAVASLLDGDVDGGDFAHSLTLEEAISKVEKYRHSYATTFNTSTTFWQDWFTFCVKVGRGAGATAVRAMKEHPCPILAESMVKAVSENDNDDISEEDCKKILECCTQGCGSDVLTGKGLWDALTAHLVDEYEDLAETGADESTLLAARTAVIKAYQAQLSCPLLGTETTLRDMEAALATCCSASAADIALVNPQRLEHTVKASLLALQKRLPYEEKLLNPCKSSEEQYRLQRWLSYAEFEVQDKQPVRALRIYERALLAQEWSEETSLGLLENYLLFVSTTLKDWHLLQSIACRGLRKHYNSDTIWCKLMLAIEQHQTRHNRSDVNVIEADALEMMGQFKLALQSGLSTVDGYLTVMRNYWGYCRRLYTSACKTSDEASAAAFKVIQDSYEVCEQFLGQYYPTWLAGWITLYRSHTIFLEESRSENLQDKVVYNSIKSIWNNGCKRFHLSSDFWIEYARWSMTSKTYMMHKHTPVVIFKAGLAQLIKDKANASMNEVSKLGAAYIGYQEEFGSIEHLLETQSRVSKATGMITAATAKMTKKKRQLDRISDDDDHSSSGAASKKHRTESKEQEAFTRVTQEAETVSMEVVVPPPAAHGQNEKQPPKGIKKPKMHSSSVNVHDREAYRSCTLQASNLSFQASEEDVRAHFTQEPASLHDVEAVQLLLSHSGRSRGICFITFSSPEVASIALKRHSESPGTALVHDRAYSLTVLPDDAKLDAIRDTPQPTTIYCVNVPKSWTEESLRNLFQNTPGKECGEISGVKILQHKEGYSSSAEGNGGKRALVQFKLVEGRSSAIRYFHKYDNGEGLGKMDVTLSKYPVLKMGPIDGKEQAQAEADPPLDDHSGDKSTDASTKNEKYVVPKKKKTNILAFKPRSASTKGRLQL
jgi:hypothetical protein